MANRIKFKMALEQRRLRKFSEGFRIEKVAELEQKRSNISEICRQYDVSSTTVYRWLKKYGKMKKKNERIIVEVESDTKKLLELKKRVAELERIVGQKQILLDFKDKMIDIAEEMYGVDIKKKLSAKPSNITGKDEKNTPSD
jgi:transposase-like protein